MKTSTRWVLAFCTVAIAFGLAWNLTPRASMEGKEKSKSNNPIPSVAPNTSYRSPGARHKVAISDSALANSLSQSGGRLVADYGSYKLLEVDSATAGTLNSNSNAQLVDENNLVLLNSGAIDTTTPEAQSMRQSASSGSGKQMRLIQFAGPIQPEWYAALLRTGVKVVTYIPNNAYLVYGTRSNLDAVRSLAASSRIVQWDGPYTSVHRLSRSLNSQAIAKDGPTKEVSKESKPGVLNRTAAKTNQLYAIQMVADKENTNTLSLINQLKTAPIVKQAAVLDYLNVVVALPQDAVVNQIAERGDVVSISTWSVPHKMDERQDQIIAGNLTGSAPTPGDYLAYLAGKGFTTTTTTFGVNISDSGVDNGSTTPNHFALYALGNPTAPANSRMVYARVVGTPSGPGSTTQGCDGHGNLNTHIIGGYVPTGTVGGVNFGVAPHADASGFRYDLGVFPYVKIGSSVIFDNSGAPTGDFTSPDYTTLESMAYNDTMRISSNSWGASDNSYSIDSQEYDALVRDAQPTGSSFPTAGNQEYVILFAAGNDGSGSNTVGLPGTAKNVITVGASEGVQSLGGTDFCGIGDAGADNANDLIGFSSRGPTSDGRKKPDIVAPGTHITGGVGQASIASPTGSGSGSAIACFDATGVCAGVGSDFFPTGQQWYTSSDGTSHSTPAMSAYAAIIRQHFINQALTPPTPAMTKALMLNTARYLNGAGANDSLFSNNQGMGEANFNSFFDIFTTGSIRRDEAAADKFTASGQQRIFTGSINTNTKPFRVTLAWTDPPGPTSGNAYVNNLDLEVSVGGNTYKGNVFSGANSATGGVADTRNNVESVFIPAGITGNFVVKVKATNIAGNGVPGDADPLDQDFALVIANATAGNIPVVEGGTATVTAESCAPANTAIDPGETVTVNLPLSNVGTANTSNLVATLQATGGVSSPSGPQNYGVVVAGGSAVTRPFTFTATTTCGQNLAITLQLQDGANNLGTVTFTMATGSLGAPSTALYSTGNIATAIPDVSSVEVPIVIAATGAVADVNARVRLNHTFDHDLVIELVAPDGTTVVLSQNRDTALGGGDNYGTGANDCSGTPTIFDDSAATAIGAGLPPFAGTFRPETPLSDLNGHSITGTWKLRVTDIEAQDVGTVGCVTLEISRQPFVCCGVSGTPVIASGGAATITAESVAPANNAPDPGETITANFPLINTGDGNTTNLVATLQNSGGVTPVTTSQNYGVVVAGGPAVSQPFTFVASGTCGNTITATLALQDGAINLGTVTYTFQLGTTSTALVTFTNATSIVIPATGTGATTGAPATPYPSNITVAGITNPVTKVTVTLKNMSHTFPDDVDVLLVGPTNRKFIVISDAGDTNDWVGATITLDDAAANSLADVASNGSGTYKPGNFGTVQDPFPAPAPAGPYLSPAPGGADTFATAFNGQNPNGTWSLHVVDDAGTDTGAFAGGWELAITSSASVCNTQTCSLTCPANITVPESPAASGGAVVNYPGATPTGSCGVLGYDIPSGSTFPLGTTTVHVTGANAATCSFTVTVTPSGGGCTGITCPANVTQSNDPNQCGAVVTYPAPTPTGTCGTISCSPASGSFFPVGSTTVNCTSTAGPACSFTVTVNDTQPPSITCPANVVVPPTPGFEGATVNYPDPTVTDNCPGVPAPVCVPASGSFFPIGVTTVTCSVGGTSCVSKTITHSSSQAITPLNSVSCNDGVGHTDNHYWRAFTLPSFSITGTFHVSSVDIGIEQASAAGGTVPSHQTKSVTRNSAGSASRPKGNRKGGSAPEQAPTQPVTVLLHTNTGGAFPAGTLNFLNSVNINVADQVGTILNVPITADVPAGSELVVEVFTPDGTATGNLFFIGSNSAAETGPSYLSAPDCGINSPTTTAAIGFPDMHIVMNVNGCEDTTGGASASCNFTVTVKSPRYWSTTGSAGTTDEDSTALVSHEDFAATLKTGLTGTATVRYNITAVQGISAYCPATQSVVYVRFRNSDNAGTHAQVKFDIHRTSILAGGNDTIFSFNSNGLGTGNVFTSASLSPNIDFDFSNYIYWIEATVFRDQAGQFADLGSVVIFEADGTPCP